MLAFPTNRATRIFFSQLCFHKKKNCLLIERISTLEDRNRPVEKNPNLIKEHQKDISKLSLLADFKTYPS